MDTVNLFITATQIDNKTIDVRDHEGIRLMLLSEVEDKGLYLYFKMRMSQLKD